MATYSWIDRGSARAVSPTRDPAERPDALLDQWAETRRVALDTKLRTPLALGSHRIAIASDRCKELAYQEQELRTRLLNLPVWSDPSIARNLEDRITRLQGELHGERLALWSDLSGLLEKISDAGVERLRAMWIDEIARIADPGTHARMNHGGGDV